MNNRVQPSRQDRAISVLGGPSTVIDMGGLRIVADPTFDGPGAQGYLTKLTGPAASASDVGAVDAVLVSHDLHPDNLDTSGRAFALAAPVVLTGPVTAGRLGSPAIGLPTWGTHRLPRPDGEGELRVTAVPAVHGPEDGARDADGHVNCEVTGFVLSGRGLPTVYVSGDNASVRVVAEISRRIGRVDVAVLFMGAARVAAKEQGRPLTLTSERGSAAAAVLGPAMVIPAHCDGWAHFSEGHAEITRAFGEAGLSDVLADPEHGEWIPLPR
ncbi:MBL fold metallo-hydrolase [Streptomyces sp. NBC_01497]|uniref:MBL fold metallo-hydrolase n=1 Tax=Streptomyces sp. NBC_01497 TaxID=2903885 RepID=UPI002E346EED|nr:MBL fold metallo-hydrolase [Streptomyces sp. NBC_01497]